MDSSSRSYGPLSSSLRPPSPAPRRAFSLPAMRAYLPSLSSTAQLLPLSSLSRPGSPGGPGSRTAKRLSYTLRSRALHNKVRLLIGTLLLTAIFLWVNSTTRALPVTHRLRARGSQTVLGNTRKHSNGVTLMDIEDTDEWLAEDDLFYSQYTEDTPLSAEDAAAEEEMASRKADVIEQNRQQSLRALTWWLAEGGEIPEDWEVPSKAYLKKVGGRGVERLLEDIEDAELGDEPMFEEGWADFAKKRYRTIVFSKQLQDLLNHLTGRRTVPNILLDFVSIGGSDDLTLMHSEGGLRRRFQDMGVLPGGRPNVFQPVGKVPAVDARPPKAEPIAAAGMDDFKKVEQIISPEDVGYPADLPKDIQATYDEEMSSGGNADEEDEDDDEDEDDTVLAPGSNPADIRAAVQAAHGDAYLSEGEDDLYSTEEFAERPPPLDRLPTDSDDSYPNDAYVFDDLEPNADLPELDVDESDDWEDGEDEEEEEDDQWGNGLWEANDEPAAHQELQRVGGGAAGKAAAAAEAARARAMAIEEQEQVKARAAQAALEAQLKRQAEAAAAKEAKVKADGNAKARAQAQAKARANQKAKAKAGAKPNAKPAADNLRKKDAAAPPPRNAPAQPGKHFKPIQPPPEKKADTLLDRSNANALQKKKAAVQAAKEKAAAAKVKKGGVEKAGGAQENKADVPPAKAPVAGKQQPVAGRAGAGARAAGQNQPVPKGNAMEERMARAKAAGAKKAAGAELKAAGADKGAPFVAGQKAPVEKKAVAGAKKVAAGAKKAGVGAKKVVVVEKKAVVEKKNDRAAGAKGGKAPVARKAAAGAGAGGEKVKPKARAGAGAGAKAAGAGAQAKAKNAQIAGKRKGRVL